MGSSPQEMKPFLVSCAPKRIFESLPVGMERNTLQ